MKPKKIIKKKPIQIRQIDQLEILNDRAKLREYSVQNSIKVPDFFISEEFSKISQWAMKKNSFPLCLKSSKNFSDSSLIYILKAFRELPEFFEKIQEKNNNEKVIIEEFIEGKAYLEATVLNKQIRLITQIGLNKSMKLQQKWRAFPIKLPQNIFDKVIQTINKFDKLTETTVIPIRFSFVIKNLEPILLSINSDNNRQEYLDDWRKQSELEPLADSVYPNSDKYINKINIYNINKEVNINLNESIKVCEKSKVKYEIIGNKLYYMVTSTSPKDLKEDFEKANSIIMQELQK
jgi:hypothetical protein